MTKVTVYQTPNCVQCMQTKKVLERSEISFDVIDLSQHPESLELVKGMGHTQSPVVVVTTNDGRTEHWSGFRLSKLEHLKKQIHGEMAPKTA